MAVLCNAQSQNPHIFVIGRTASILYHFTATKHQVMSDVKLDIDRLIFPSASRSITQFLTDSRRSALTISARLKSIDQDAQFVQKVQAAYNLPLIANERCGSWYIDPVSKAQSAYFKSTDGHTGQWSLSLRRLNLQVLEAISHGDGCVYP